MLTQNAKSKQVLIMAGGTGGHIFPGLATAEAMLQEGWQITWLGALNGLETKLVPARGIVLYTLPIRGLRGKGWSGLLTAPWRLGRAVYKAWRLLKRLSPDVVVGFGGYASGPGAVAAWLLRIPLIIHEQNAIAGMTNRILAKFANLVLQAFPNTFRESVRAITVGNPIRKELLMLPAPAQRMINRSKPGRLLVMGGSRGAMALNKAIAEGLALIPPELRPEIWHQTGEAHFLTTQTYYQANAVVARIEPFIDNMAEAYAWADFIICRAGALTVSELAAVGIGSILVPYPYAVDDHQMANARFLEQRKAAVIVPQTEFSPERFVNLYQTLIAEPNALLNLAQAAYEQRQIDAVQIIKNYCEKNI
ncbi:MAG: murG [Gammaproteobacteria bacterium]|jgi:UDP-N-acetylglucosamine--N-acetylmuramyl-(pentapeptide) pyrophosphoryl-undecaprenol N-acetylglucosamine transferase|nr:murG [Gammaproteobacteria bacterium]